MGILADGLSIGSLRSGTLQGCIVQSPSARLCQLRFPTNRLLHLQLYPLCTEIIHSVVEKFRRLLLYEIMLK